MSTELTHLKVHNFRSLADVSLDLGPLNIVFGPNAAGKSTLLDTLWFVRDCAINGVEQASASRSHGIGMLWDGAEPGAQVVVEVTTDEVSYTLRVGFAAGRIEPFLGERLVRLADDRVLIERSVGSEKAFFSNKGLSDRVPVPLREPHKTSLGRYLDFADHPVRGRSGQRLDAHL